MQFIEIVCIREMVIEKKSYHVYSQYIYLTNYIYIYICQQQIPWMIDDSMAKLLPIEPLEMFLSIAPQGHASVSLSGPGDSPVMWRALPEKVHQVIMSMPDKDCAIVIPKTYQDKNAMFAAITAYDVHMGPYEQHDNFINRVKDSTDMMMPENAFGYIQKDHLGHDVSEEPLNQHMIVTDVTKNILSEHGMVQKTFTPFMPHEHDFKHMVAYYQDTVQGRNVLNVVASWSF